MNPRQRVLRYFRPYKKRVALTMGAAAGATLAAMAPPALWKLVIDSAIPAGDMGLLWRSVVAILLAMLLRDGLNSLRIRWNNRLEQQVILDLRNDIYGHMQTLSQRFYADRSTGELMSRVVEDVNHVERVLLDGAEQVLIATLTLVGVGVLMFRMHPTLAVVALIPVPFLVLGAVWYTRRMRANHRKAREASAEMNATLHDSLSGLLQVKIFNREREQAEQFATGANEYRKAQLNVMYTWALFSPGMNLLGSIGLVLVLIVGGRALLLEQAGVTIGTLIAFYGYLGLFYEPINRLHSLNNLWQDALAASDRVFEIMDTEPDIAEPAVPRVLDRPVAGRVMFDSVQFAYNTERLILNDINLDVAAGESIAIVGPTGTGKTTLVNLIPRFYDVTGGSVRIDGMDVRDLSLATLRQQVAVVSQEPFLFNSTVGENILLGNPQATPDHMRWAAELANAASFIERLPRGYDTPVGERGVKLSVGEKQRVCIARALLKDAPIIILDEATASVDTITEYQIQEALERLRQGRTTFIIAHRLSTIREVDRIVCLENGEIVECGSHDELIKADGLYASLVQHQTKPGTPAAVDLA